MKLLVFGGTGMAGHMIIRYFQQQPKYEVYYTTRDQTDSKGIYVDVTDSTSVEKVIETVKPDISINCIGILNAHAERETKLAFQVNSLLPHQLAKLMERSNGKLIHISTDCVFSGSKGDYTETDPTDGTSIYAQSKQLGEVFSDRHLTIRTSIIGPELKEDGIGLFLWFMKQQGTIKGFEKVMWNGVTTLELAKAIHYMIENQVSGLYHLGSSNKISKHELLTMIQEIYQKTDVTIIPDQKMIQDRSIRNTRTDVGYQIQGYREMLEEMRGF